MVPAIPGSVSLLWFRMVVEVPAIASAFRPAGRKKEWRSSPFPYSKFPDIAFLFISWKQNLCPGLKFCFQDINRHCISVYILEAELEPRAHRAAWVALCPAENVSSIIKEGTDNGGKWQLNHKVTQVLVPV